MRILFYSTTFALNSSDGNAHYRLALPSLALSEFGGHDTVLVPNIVPNERTGKLAGRTFGGDLIEDADVVVLQLQTSLPEMSGDIERARQAGQTIVADFDDLLTAARVGTLMKTINVGGMSVVVPVDESEDAALRAQGSADLNAVLRSCDALTVATPYLRDHFAAQGGMPPIHVLRNAVDSKAWGVPEDISDGPVLGWTGRIQWRADDLSVLRPWLGDFLKKHDLRFVHVGDEPGTSFAEVANVDPRRVERRGVVTTVRDYAQTRPLRGVDVQLIPLVDHPFSRGKSALKGMESAACGVPFVASPHDEYKWLGCGRLTGFDIANQKPKFWIAALEAMLDPGERSRVAKEARERVEKEDIRVRWSDWEEVYEREMSK